mmetsp:Transcript_26832/g.63659  ORF Transcript_26832/g.63659 Transcript_26832/m.63659 type:complete len:137 (+) Transcript_26832:35-445(+)
MLLQAHKNSNPHVLHLFAQTQGAAFILLEVFEAARELTPKTPSLCSARSSKGHGEGVPRAASHRSCEVGLKKTSRAISGMEICPIFRAWERLHGALLEVAGNGKVLYSFRTCFSSCFSWRMKPRLGQTDGRASWIL